MELVDERVNYMALLDNPTCHLWEEKEYPNSTLDEVEAAVLDEYGKEGKLHPHSFASIILIDDGNGNPHPVAPVVSEYDFMYGWLRFDPRRRNSFTSFIYKKKELDETGKNKACKNCVALVRAGEKPMKYVGRATHQMSLDDDPNAWICVSCYIDLTPNSLPNE